MTRGICRDILLDLLVEMRILIALLLLYYIIYCHIWLNLELIRYLTNNPGHCHNAVVFVRTALSAEQISLDFLQICLPIESIYRIIRRNKSFIDCRNQRSIE